MLLLSVSIHGTAGFCCQDLKISGHCRQHCDGTLATSLLLYARVTLTPVSQQRATAVPHLGQRKPVLTARPTGPACCQSRSRPLPGSTPVYSSHGPAPLARAAARTAGPWNHGSQRRAAQPAPPAGGKRPAAAPLPAPPGACSLARPRLPRAASRSALSSSVVPADGAAEAGSRQDHPRQGVSTLPP